MIGSISVIAVPQGPKFANGQRYNRVQLQQSFVCCHFPDALVLHSWVTTESFCIIVQMEKSMQMFMHIIRSVIRGAWTQMLSESMVWLQLHFLFPAETLSSLYLDSADFPSGSQCNDLSLSARTEESLPIFLCRVKTHLIKRDVMSPTQLPFSYIFLFSLFFCGNNFYWAFLCLTWHMCLTQLHQLIVTGCHLQHVVVLMPYSLLLYHCLLLLLFFLWSIS